MTADGQNERSADRKEEGYELTPDAVRGAAIRTLKEALENGTTVDQASYTEGDTMRAAVTVAVDSVFHSKEQNPQTSASTLTSTPETAEVDPRLTRYKEQYDGSGNSKLKAVPWATIQSRILEDEDFRLKAALDLKQGGELFGIDKEGNPLISDGGDEPVMKGMDYKNTRDRVLWKHDKNDITGKLIPGEDGQPQLTGYEMFGYNKPYEKSDEIEQYESHTGKHFVQSPGKKDWCSSWLESGDTPSWPRGLRSRPGYAVSYVDFGDPAACEGVDRGVRRLLRVRKKT